MPRRARGRRHTGGGSWSARQPSSAAVPLPPGAPLFWFDFSDISTMYQTEDQSTPVTASLQNIGRIESKGSATDVLIQTTEGDRPVWTEAHLGGRGCGTFDGTNHYLAVTPTSGATAERTALYVFSPNANSGSDMIMAWDQNETNARLSNTRNCNMYFNSAQVGASGAYTADTDLAMWGNDDGASSQTAVYSWDATQDTTSNISGAHAADLLMHVGAWSTGGNTFPGDIGEIIIWNGTVTLEECQAYVTAKWGISWA